MNLPIIKTLIFNYNTNNIYVSVPFMVTKIKIITSHINEQNYLYPNRDFHACINSPTFGYETDVVINKFYTANLEFLPTQEIIFYQPVHINGSYTFKICDFIDNWVEYNSYMCTLLVEFSGMNL